MNPSPEPSPWQPIATAPRNNETVLLCVPRLGVITGRRGKPQRRWTRAGIIEVDTWIVLYWCNFDFVRRNPPTHWMPLPPPPSEP